MIIKLADINTEMVQAWNHEFNNSDNVMVYNQSIFDIDALALVSPANSFGIMDGGLDGKIRDFFGVKIEKLVRWEIEDRYNGELPVGCAITIKTDHDTFPFLISAPTMRVPEMVGTTMNAYLAMRAILIECRKNNIDSVVIPGLCALSGQMPYHIVARQMKVALDKVINKSIHYTHWREEKELQSYMLCRTEYLPYDYESR